MWNASMKTTLVHTSVSYFSGTHFPQANILLGSNTKWYDTCRPSRNVGYDEYTMLRDERTIKITGRTGKCLLLSRPIALYL